MTKDKNPITKIDAQQTHPSGIIDAFKIIKNKKSSKTIPLTKIDGNKAIKTPLKQHKDNQKLSLKKEKRMIKN
ncbi:hypothetical protein MCFN_02750 [Mycoplasmopsis californica]|uniref:Uncharacterized protein n=1 Tax=Mycoplasmopsis californica TaxID=2113 RepID=A0A059XS85_9BACT|nr:hypothetical protein [Mycoplasmopsis californica]AIA29668.1 hypothetical protein MCFN_02750 [Mycoplasmopsis californica]